jgi:hypothetical protein
MDSLNMGSSSTASKLHTREGRHLLAAVRMLSIGEIDVRRGSIRLAIL